MPKAEVAYYDFHGREPKTRKKVNFHNPKTLIVLGKAKAIEYVCNKYHGGGDGRRATYRHVFTTPALVCMDEKQNGQLYIIGRKVKVTSAGIEN